MSNEQFNKAAELLHYIGLNENHLLQVKRFKDSGYDENGHSYLQFESSSRKDYGFKQLPPDLIKEIFELIEKRATQELKQKETEFKEL